uniref:C2H2-type domain-containing protein n=1 Tax=Meloidogyne floridensis TaxID=298350 RepID=A0A915NXJ4_9BILA
MSVYSIATANKVMACLICGQVQPKNSFLSHISEHLNYKQHKCLECNFTSVTPEEMADHEAANNGHTAQFHILRNPYMDRVCRFIYNDCDYGERNGGLDNVLKRKLASSKEDETSSQHKNNSETTSQQTQQNNSNREELLSKQTSLIQQQLIRATTTAIMKSEQFEFSANNPTKNPTPQRTTESQPITKPKNSEPLREQMQNVVVRIKNAISEVSQSQNEQIRTGVSTNGSSSSSHTETLNSNECMMPDDPEIIDIDDEDGDEEIVGNNAEALWGKEDLVNMKLGRKHDDNFAPVQCLKCGEWVKGRAICLLYHINTRHLMLPIFKCLACPKDFYYVNETAPKKHMISFHQSDFSQFENNYMKYSQEGINKKPNSGSKSQANMPTTSSSNSSTTTVEKILEQIQSSCVPKMENINNRKKIITKRT